ncbi:MAG: HAD family hydrolase [Phycisphaerae bacterium]|jgi:NagD protein|nr:HAD family hydrolase [Phycisphaerae bacterium]
MTEAIQKIQSKCGFICDMDGVIYHGPKLLPGAKEFVDWLQREKKQFLFLTNSSERTPRDLRQKLLRMGIDVEEKHFMTSALATASFLASQCPNGRAYVIGETGLNQALYDVGFSMDDTNPDYVVVGETRAYNYEKIEIAIRLVLKGAKLIGTNTDLTGPTERGIAPACRALIAPIELSTGCLAYFIGKPNPLIMRDALKRLGCKREDTVIIGDRMDTDIIAGIESEIETVLVMSGITREEDFRKFPYRPNHVFSGVGEICGGQENQSNVEHSTLNAQR